MCSFAQISGAPCKETVWSKTAPETRDCHFSILLNERMTHDPMPRNLEGQVSSALVRKTSGHLTSAKVCSCEQTPGAP